MMYVCMCNATLKCDFERDFLYLKSRDFKHDFKRAFPKSGGDFERDFGKSRPCFLRVKCVVMGATFQSRVQNHRDFQSRV
jgi:hypothetical protein